MKQLNVTINFDMDGTITDLYGVENWLPMLQSHNPTPYEIAPPLLRLSHFARVLNALQRKGYKIAIVSWLSKSTDEKYSKEVRDAKLNWLAQHLPSVVWDRITIVEHGTPKTNYCQTPDDILFDDEEKNRNDWNGTAYDVKNILEILTKLLTN